jgi:hypothetical protein
MLGRATLCKSAARTTNAAAVTPGGATQVMDVSFHGSVLAALWVQGRPPTVTRPVALVPPKLDPVMASSSPPAGSSTEGCSASMTGGSYVHNGFACDKMELAFTRIDTPAPTPGGVTHLRSRALEGAGRARWES